jgi:hypothetical protein
MNTVGRVIPALTQAPTQAPTPVPNPFPTPVPNPFPTPVRTPEPLGPAFLSIEHRTALASLPDLYIDPRLESWQSMNRRYQNFAVKRYDTFGFGADELSFPNEFRYDDRGRYEEFMRGENGRFFVLVAFRLRPRQQNLPLTREQRLQIQHIDDILARSEREMHGPETD